TGIQSAVIFRRKSTVLSLQSEGESQTSYPCLSQLLSGTGDSELWTVLDLNKLRGRPSNQLPNLKRFIKRGLFLLALLSLPTAGVAAIYHVGSISDLNTRISSAVAGDTIILSNGVYTAS